MKVIVQPGAGVKKWWEAKHLAASRFFNMQKQKYMESYWMLIQSSGIMLTTGQGGSMTTGNVARKLLHDPPDHEMVMSTQHPWGEWVGQEFGTMSSLILRFVSSSWEVDLDDYRALCTWLYFSLALLGYHGTVVQGGQKYEKWLCFLASFISYLETSCQMWLRTTFFCWYINLMPSGNYFLPKKAYFLL